MKRSKISQLLASSLYNSIYQMKNFPMMLIMSMVSPFSLLFVITVISRGALIGVAIEGAFIMTMVSAGLSLVNDLSHYKNDLRLQDMVVSSPTTAFIYIVGMGLSELIYYLPSLVILIALAALFIHMSAIVAMTLAGVMLLMFALALSLAFVFATITSDVVQGWPFVQILSILLSTLPPVYYPITYIPLPYRYIAYLSPTTYAAQLAQAATGFLAPAAVNAGADWAVLVIVTIIILIIAAKKTRWRER